MIGIEKHFPAPKSLSIKYSAFTILLQLFVNFLKTGILHNPFPSFTLTPIVWSPCERFNNFVANSTDCKFILSPDVIGIEKHFPAPKSLSIKYSAFLIPFCANKKEGRNI